MKVQTDLRAVILAGGSGTRLWPLSRLQAPKQFLQLTGDQTLLDATIARVSPRIPGDRILIVAGEETAMGEGYRFLAPYETLLEPVGRNTAPAIALAALRFRLAGEDPVLVVLPSDHLIRDVAAFQQNLEVAVAGAEAGHLVTFGITPTHPATGFGYIACAEKTGSLRKVGAFVEKPDAATAERFLAEGGHFWNSGMFVWKASVILEEVRRALPDLAALLDEIGREAGTPAGLQAAVRKHFGRAPSISIDHGVLQSSERLRVVPATFDWSDMGSWDSVHDVAEKDENRNAIRGNVVALDCRNTLLRSDSRLVAAIGVEDISVVETPDAVLVTRRGQSQRVRDIVAELTRRHAEEAVTHLTVNRPWGSYTVLQSTPGCKIKRIEVRPGGRLSLQSHDHRSEHWVVTAGEATVTIDGQEKTLRRNESTYVPIGTKHRLENRGTEPVHIIEVQVGDRVEESDIHRHDDFYGRKTL